MKQEMMNTEQFSSYYHDLETCNQLSTDALMQLLTDPQDVDPYAILFTLFQRDAKDQVLANFPNDQDNILRAYHQYRQVEQIIGRQDKEWVN